MWIPSGSVRIYDRVEYFPKSAGGFLSMGTEGATIIHFQDGGTHTWEGIYDIECKRGDLIYPRKPGHIKIIYVTWEEWQKAVDEQDVNKLCRFANAYVSKGY